MEDQSANPSFKALWARRLVRVKLAAELNALADKAINEPDEDYSFVPLPVAGRRWSPDDLPADKIYRDEATKHKLLHAQPSDSIKDDLPPRKVCIVGAGVAGLYIAMILDDLKIPNLTYEILESNSRVGGRVYTHNFSDKIHDYYDIGAMRYPKIKSMARTFELFERTGVKQIPYYLSSDATPSLFNDRLYEKDVTDPYKVSVANDGDVPDDVVDRVSAILGDAFKKYKDLMVVDFKRGFEELMTVDDYSTREYLKRGGPDNDPNAQYNFYAIQWMETQNTSTNLFDQAFSESVIDSFDFDNPTDPDWVCIEGGTTEVIKAMQASLSTPITTGKRVRAISIDKSSDADGNMSVECADDDKRDGYCTVFNTAPLGCVGRMDLRGLDLHPSQKDAIRSLHYDDSVKVALKFKEPWWINKCGITQGGVASTDLPLRTCVYPSYNLHDGARNPAVLLASYTWAQDANRMGSLVDPPSGEELIDLILRNLGRLHQAHITYEEIKALYDNEFNAFSWSHDPNSAGAFALFGPGQFSNLYPRLMRPAARGKFHFVGEAASAHHAWIVGALDSAYSAVYKFLYNFNLHDHLALLEKNWGTVGELETGEFGTVHLQIALGSAPKEFKLKV